MHFILWEYIVRTGWETEFQKIYGPSGDWVKLFKQAEGYLGTDLLHDAEIRRRYVTIDRWASSAAFDLFQEKYCDEYKAIDARCESLIEREARMGIFST